MSNGEEPRTVADRYLLLDRLGSGGMGTVWRASDQLLGRTVAVKEVHLHRRGDELTELVERAHREARAVAQISHPGVINIYDLVAHDEGLWLVMELVDGPSLASHIAVAGPMTPATVAGIGLQLLAALEAVHATGALHRDIKPANVLLRPDGRVVLCDFGIATLVGTDPLTATGGMVGSAEYIAPERLSGRAVGPASDLFSLGGTLCALLCGRSPFARPEAAAVLHAVATAPPDIPDAAGPLRHLLEALLQKDPASRPSIGEAAGMLRSVTAGTSLEAPVPPPAHPIGPHARTFGTGPGRVPSRRRLQRALLAGVLLLAGGVTTGLLVNRSGDADGDGADAAPSGNPSTGGHSPTTAAPSHIDAVLPVPDDPNLEAPSGYWLFSDDRYLRVRTSSGSRPVRERLAGPSSLGRWKSTMGDLAGFQGGIDAALRVPGHTDEYWVFSKDRYIRIRIGDGPTYDDTLVSPPAPISDWRDAFAGLPANGVDAFMPVPDDADQVWVFSGNQYVRTQLNGEKPGGTVREGPHGFQGWTGTFGKVSGFRKGFDAAMPVPGERNQYWVFSGTRYMKIRVTDVAYADTVLQPPKELHL